MSWKTTLKVSSWRAIIPARSVAWEGMAGRMRYIAGSKVIHGLGSVGSIVGGAQRHVMGRKARMQLNRVPP